MFELRDTERERRGEARRGERSGDLPEVHGASPFTFEKNHQL